MATVNAHLVHPRFSRSLRRIRGPFLMLGVAAVLGARVSRVGHVGRAMHLEALFVSAASELHLLMGAPGQTV